MPEKKLQPSDCPWVVYHRDLAMCNAVARYRTQSEAADMCARLNAFCNGAYGWYEVDSRSDE